MASPLNIGKFPLMNTQKNISYQQWTTSIYPDALWLIRHTQHFSADGYSLHRIDELLNQFGKSRYFTSFGLTPTIGKLPLMKGIHTKQNYVPTVDFRPLNRVTVFDNYPLPRIEELLYQLGKSRYFTSFGLAFDYWRIPIDGQGHTQKTFRTNSGLYQITWMPFVLFSTGNTFQRMVNSIFHDLISQGLVLVYLNDFLVHTAF